MAPDTSCAPTATRPLCFAIGPYGAEETDTRKWSNFLFEKILEPVLRDEYQVQRTIDDPEPGKISSRIERDLQDARVVVADLTGGNPNVYFEMGYRHALDRPLVHVARAGTELPFDVRDFDVITINADFVEKKGYFTIPDDELQRARKAVHAQLKKIGSKPQPPAPPDDPVSAKVYHWQMWYSPQIAQDWLGAQRAPFQEEVRSYETGGGADAVSEGSLQLFAEYLALKSAASLSGDGTIFLTMNNHTRRLDFGYAIFRFATVPDAVPIKVVDASCSREGVQTIRFVQQSRPFPVERGGRIVTVTIPGYNYTLQVQPDPISGAATGTITHPHSRTTIGVAELTPRYGEFLR